jgi:hypothetical protein
MKIEPLCVLVAVFCFVFSRVSDGENASLTDQRQTAAFWLAGAYSHFDAFIIEVQLSGFASSGEWRSLAALRVPCFTSEP